jgi:TonB family protein
MPTMRRLVLLLLAASFALAQEATPPLRVGGDVKAPEIVSRFDPPYTEEARKQRVSGIVIIEAAIDKTGSVTDAHVLKGLPYGLEEAAVAAVKQWMFKPATLNGKPVDVLFNVVVKFELRPDAPTTVILVRHAEKAVPGAGMNEDPPLSAAGEQRARELARVLGDVAINAIYTTPYARTRSTAAPIATKLHLTPEEVKVGATYASDMAILLTTQHHGETVLVVGHSNTTRDVLRALGITNAPNIDDAEYDNLFIVTIAEGFAPKMVRLRYGS